MKTLIRLTLSTLILALGGCSTETLTALNDALNQTQGYDITASA